MGAVGTGRSPTTGQRVREVLAGSGFRRFLAARLVSQLGDGVFQLATADILLFRNPSHNPAAQLATVTALTLIPFSAIGPFAGVFIDRWERRKILTVVPALRACLALSVPFIASGGGARRVAFYAALLVVLSANRFFLATMSAVLPQLVPEEDLLVANSVSATGGSVANVAGLGLGAVLSQLIEGSNAAVVAAVAFAVAAVAASMVPARRGKVPARAPLREEIRVVTGELAEGLRRVLESRRATFALSSITAVQVLVGAMTAATTFYFIAVLGLSVGGSAGLLGFIGLGVFAGVLAVPFVARRLSPEWLVPASFVIGFAAMLGVAPHVTKTTITAGGLLVGASYAFAKIPVDTIVQQEIPDAYRGRAFAAYDMLFNLARTAGVAIVAGAIELGPSTGGLVLGIGVAYAAALAGTVAWVRRLGRSAGPPLVLVPGELVAVRAYAGSRADEEPRALVLGDRDLDVEEVEWRAVEERGGERRRAFVVRLAGGARVRLSIAESETRWEIDRILPPRADNPPS